MDKYIKEDYIIERNMCDECLCYDFFSAADERKHIKLMHS